MSTKTPFAPAAPFTPGPAVPMPGYQQTYTPDMPAPATPFAPPLHLPNHKPGDRR